MADTWGTVVGLVTALVGDREGLVWDSPSLLAFGNAAYRDFQDQLAANGITTNRSVATIAAVPAATVAIGLATSPPLPADLVAPYGLEERAGGSADLFQPMTESDLIPLPDRTADAVRGVWAWYQNQIFIPVSTQATDLRVDYESRLTPFTSSTDPVGIIGGANVLANQVAAMVAYSRGDAPNGDRQSSYYSRALNGYMRTQVQGQQFKAGRRVPFSHKRGLF